MTSYINTLISIIAITLISTSCALDINSDPTVTDTETSTDTELDSLEDGEFLGSFMNVSGLTYQTASQSGVTSKNGNFIYRQDETITFYLGDIPLPEVKAKTKLSPFDLYNESYPVQQPDNYESASLSLTAFITMFDYDNQPENGIELTDETINLINQYNFNFENPTTPIHHTTLDNPLIIAKQNRILKTTSNAFDPEQALIHLYNWMEKDLYVYGGRKSESDTGVYTTQYNFDGNTLNSIQKFDNDTLDGWIDYIYVDGNLTEKNHNNLRDSESYDNDRYTYHYDEHNFLDNLQRQRNDFITTQTWLYDSFGVAQSYSPTEDMTTEYSYDDKGRRISVEKNDLDSNGTSDEILKFIEIDGLKILIGEDLDANGFYEISTDINIEENEYTVLQDLDLNDSYDQVSITKYNINGGELFQKIDYQNDDEFDYVRTTNYNNGLIDNIQTLEYGELIEHTTYHHLDFDKFWYETFQYLQQARTHKIHYDGTDDYIELNYYSHDSGLEFLGEISLFLTKAEIDFDGVVTSEYFTAQSGDYNSELIYNYSNQLGEISLPAFFDFLETTFNDQINIEYTDNGRVKSINISLEGDASEGRFASFNLDYSDYEEITFLEFTGEIDFHANPRQTFQYERNNQGELTAVNWDLFSDGHFEYQTEFTNGVLTSKSVQPSYYNGDYYNSIHTYNEASQLLTQKYYVSDDGSADRDNTYTYYDSGLLKSDTENNLNWVFDYEYNDLNLLKFEKESVDNTQFYSTEYFYESITD